MRHRILVVAHDVMLRSTLARWLMSAGYSVKLAEGERQAQRGFPRQSYSPYHLGWRTFRRSGLGPRQKPR
jgi:DNA-binding NtrC family response regulator